MLESLRLAGPPANLLELQQAINHTTPRPVLLPLLTSLEVANIPSPSVLLNLLRLFRIPRLIHLSLAEMLTELANNEDIPVEFSSVLEVIGLQGGPLEYLKDLQSLSLAYVACGQDTVVRESMLYRLSNLRRLEVVEMADRANPNLPWTKTVTFLWTTVFLSTEDRQKSQLLALPLEVPCPLLEELAVSGLHAGFILHAAKARKAAGVPFKRIVFDSRDLDRLSERTGRMFEEAGVELDEYERPEDDPSKLEEILSSEDSDSEEQYVV